MNLSAIILTKNEQRHIKECIKSVDFCDEIVVIDDNSTDRTVGLARKMGAKVFPRELAGDFAGQRNFGLEKASGKWCLFVDADERVSERLRNEIVEKIKRTDLTGYLIKRKDVFLGKTINYGESGNIKLLRLARKGAGKWQRKVHEYWDIFGRKATLNNSLDHYPHPTLKIFIDQVNKYSTLHAQANDNEQKKASIIKIMFWPKAKFIQNYIFKLGFLDGSRGLVIALMMSFHSFLSWSKLWLTQNKPFRK